MKPLEFYRLGTQMASSANSEAHLRTAISRIYYGLHHESCCRYFRKEPSAQPLNRNQRHTELRERFNRPDDPVASKVSQLLNNLIAMRSEADYQLAPPLRYRGRSYSPEQLTQRALETGRELLQALEDYSPGESPDGCSCPVAYTSR